jgi:molybdate-binding protein/DNA-binding transcriptional regulator YhcF (GntR family)
MDDARIYQKIAATIRQQILSGKLSPGDRLPPMRQMADEWSCTIGTIQHAYQELSHQGLVASRPGQGTHVVGQLPQTDDTPLRQITLVHRAEAFLLEVLTAGYEPVEVEQAVRMALDRWRAAEQRPLIPSGDTVKFAGSHDLAVAWLAGHFGDICPGFNLQVTFTGSLGGLIALAEGQAELAGSHLWEAETNSYNRPFVRRLFPGKRVALVTLAYRRLGLILPPGNPQGIQSLEDLSRYGTRFINRQSGSGTRVWLEAQLHSLGVDPQSIQGYGDEAMTHSEVAGAIAEERVGAGLGLEASARAYGLSFIPLQLERYDLVIPKANLERPPLGKLVDWLQGVEARKVVGALEGYDTRETGNLIWVE